MWWKIQMNNNVIHVFFIKPITNEFQRHRWRFPLNVCKMQMQIETSFIAYLSHGIMMVNLNFDHIHIFRHFFFRSSNYCYCKFVEWNNTEWVIYLHSNIQLGKKLTKTLLLPFITTLPVYNYLFSICTAIRHTTS